MSYLINEEADVFVVGYNSSDYDPPTTNGVHPIDTEFYSNGQLDSSNYKFRVNNSSYFTVGDFLGYGSSFYQVFDCKINGGHFLISKGYAVRTNADASTNMDDGMYERCDADFDLITAAVPSDAYHSGVLIAENTRIIGVKTS